jgi:hypothetical protein
MITLFGRILRKGISKVGDTPNTPAGDKSPASLYLTNLSTRERAGVRINSTPL